VSDGRELDDELPDESEDEESDEEGSADSAGTVWCPYCGEPNEVLIDPAGGTHQDYVEDCQVCCRPWRLLVTFNGRGRAEVDAERADD
jgi:hypothetical protein